MVLTLVFVVLLVLVAYYLLGTPLLDFIQRFTKEFSHTFPLWSFFLPVPAARAPRPSSHRSQAPRHPSPTPRTFPRR